MGVLIEKTQKKLSKKIATENSKIESLESLVRNVEWKPANKKEVSKMSVKSYRKFAF